jgi:hypothetical protein
MENHSEPLIETFEVTDLLNAWTKFWLPAILSIKIVSQHLIEQGNVLVNGVSFAQQP